MALNEYTSEEMAAFSEEQQREISRTTDLKYCKEIPVLPEDVDIDRTKMYLACKLQRLPYKAGRLEIL